MQISDTDTIDKGQSEIFSNTMMKQESSKSSSAICTLFEGSYHYGLAAIANSLYAQGFTGDIYAGYRGQLPQWAAKAQPNEKLLWKDAVTLHINKDLTIHFLPLQTDYHLTNYKPDFMLELWDGPASGVEQLFYFDPDIIVDTRWSFFTEWVNYGIAVCEDLNSPLPTNHPRRKAWRKFFSGHGIHLNFREANYANGGFIGLKIEDKDFLRIWKLLQEKMALEIGGLGVSQFDSSQTKAVSFSDPHYYFSKTDQDALNAAIEAWKGETSFVGKEGMGFRSGSALLPHAVGGAKPWNRNAIKMAFQGNPPRRIDHCYWRNVKGPIVLYSSLYQIRKQTAHKIAALIGRFYKRS
ncbi:MAG: hypothetical protein EOO10_03880 [Chitinophagaceae bacterium]|nr:MAG: hypothetical protein EOO10_03880 [Chitinophagaceae bacterium]